MRTTESVIKELKRLGFRERKHGPHRSSNSDLTFTIVPPKSVFLYYFPQASIVFCYRMVGGWKFFYSEEQDKFYYNDSSLENRPIDDDINIATILTLYRNS